MAVGFSFDPSADQGVGPAGPDGLRKKPVSPVQNAIQYLSLRLPQVVGAQSPVMPALLGGAGQMGRAPSPHVDAIVNSVLGKVLGPDQVSAPQVPPPSMAAPAALPPSPPVPVPSVAPPPPSSFAPPPSPGPTGPPSAPAPVAPPVASAMPLPRPPIGPPAFSFHKAAPEPSLIEGGQTPGTYSAPTAPGLHLGTSGSAPTGWVRDGYGPDMRPHEIPQRASLPNQWLIDEAVKRVGTGGDWNQYQSLADADPFVKLFAETFGRGGNWNAFKPGG